LAKTINPSGSTSFDRLLALIETLRGENGCPWDRKQTPASVTRYIIEEAYELVDAVLAGDPEAVCDEAGDVLFQILFVIHLFSEAGHFSVQDVIDKNIRKMVRRHPHVFGDATAKTPEKVSENWDRIKRGERGAKVPPSLLNSIPKGMPALARAAMVSERAAKTGFDWDDISGVMAKAMEEWEEFSTELDSEEGAIGSDSAAMEFGDVLFTMVNVARFARIHPETALIRSIQKFEERFRHMEAAAAGEAGRGMDRLSFEEMHALWEEAKTKIR
jgi:tetrapyrrole methylase family protein/MazG family protein